MSRSNSPRNSPQSSQPDEPTEVNAQAFVEYSRSLHEWTLQRWFQAVREREERNRTERDYNALQSLPSQSQAPQQAQQPPTTQQPTQASPGPSGSVEPAREEDRNPKSPQGRDKKS